MIYEIDNIILTPITKERLNRKEYHNWLEDPIVCRFNSHGRFPLSDKELYSFISEFESGKILVWSIDYKLMICAKHELIYVGNVSLQEIDWINRKAELAILIGNKEYWKKDIATKACQLALYHGFKQLNLHRIWLGTSDNNDGMINVAKKIGMKSEGVLIDSLFLNGKYTDELRFGILEDEWNKTKDALIIY